MPCIRSGTCCKKIQIPLSPKDLREPEKWEDGYIVQDMLEGRCLGKEKVGENEYRYWYGPCKHLSFANGLATCNIHNNKPRVCSGYPDYHNPMTLFRGCGYFKEGTIEFAPFEARDIEPLSEDEK